MEEWLHPVLRTLHYALVLGLFGLTAFPPVGLPGIAGGRPGKGVTAMAVAAPCVSAVLVLVGFATMMGQALSGLESEAVRALLLSTTIGWAFLVRLALLTLAIPFVRSRPRVAAALYAGVLMTLPWSGHAAAGEGLPGMLHRLNDGLHLLAAGLWFGAVAWFALLAARTRRSGPDAAALLAAMYRFTPLGLTLVAIVSLTGLVNAHLIYGLPSTSTVLQTGYGQWLAAKVVLVGLMLVCASAHARRVRDAASRQAAACAEPGTIVSAVRVTLVLEMALALGVVGAVAVLGLLSPAVH